MARLYRDAHGIPHLRADSVLDLVHAQGWVTARDRTWQVEWLRRRATGTTAAAVGATGLPWDEFSRRMDTVGTARRALAACSPETQQFVTSYVDGLNAGLAEVDPTTVPELARLGIAAEPWEAWTPLATFLAQHLLFANIGGRLWRRLAEEVLGDDARLLSHEGPLPSGSNAWAAAGGRTASGLPLVAGDPHRVIEQPGVYQQVRLACDDPDDTFDVAGFTFVGVPGVQHFAHAGEVAWAITNACADYQDLREESVPPREVVERHVETIEVLGPSTGSGTSVVEVEVVRTPWGMLLEDGLSVRTASWLLGDLGFDALLPLLRARSVDDVDRALDHWVEPVNNAVIADRSGAVRYRIAGRVPVRDEAGEWTGWLAEPNRADVPADGHVVTANERRGPESARVGSVFAPPYRAARLHALLAGRTDLTPADFVALHNDTLLEPAATLTALVPGGFDDFDGRMDADSAAAGRYAAWRSEVVRRLADHPVLAPLGAERPGHAHSPVFAPWLGHVHRIGLALPMLAAEALAGRPPFGIDLSTLAKEALAHVDGGDTPPVWGETHVMEPFHALEDLGFDAGIPSLSVSGDGDCVRCTASYPALTDLCFRGSVARYVWDLADRTAGGWVVPTGADGRPGPHHHDQQPLWVEGTLAPIVDDWAQLTEESSLPR